MLTAVLLLVCMILLVGAAWARYRTEQFSYLNYGLREPDALSLWGYYNPATGQLSGESSWEIADGAGTLDFYISNGTLSDYAEKDKAVSIRLISSLTLQEIEVWLTVGNEEWEAEVLTIRQGTDIHEKFGEGQVYIFKDVTGKELNWTLDGGALSVLPAQFYVTGLEEQESSITLLQVQVTEEASGY